MKNAIDKLIERMKRHIIYNVAARPDCRVICRIYAKTYQIVDRNLKLGENNVFGSNR